MKCNICQTRKPRRYCPGVRGEICSQCCGEQREVTVSCPLDCQYLQEARLHEKYVPVDKAHAPNSDIEITTGFLNSHNHLINFLGVSLLKTLKEDQDAVDRDVREALEAFTRTYRTLNTGLIYDTQPINPYAKRIYSELRKGIAELMEKLREEGGSFRDAEILGVAVFFHRLSLTYDNQRPKGRAFIDMLWKQFRSGWEAAKAPGSPLIEV